MALRSLQGFALLSLLVWTCFLLLLNIDSLPEVSRVAVGALPLFVAAAALLACRAHPRPFSLLPYFFGSVFVFFCMSVALWPIATYSPFEFYSLVSLEIDAPTMARAACLLGISLSTTMLAYAATIHGTPRAPEQAFAPSMVMKNDGPLARLGLRMMVVAFPFIAYRLYLELSYILEAGYLALYSEGLGSADVPSWFAPFNYVFYAGFGLVCAFSDERRQVSSAIAMFLVVALVDGMKGARGAIIVPILFCWWFYSSRFDVKLKLGRMFMYAIAALGIFLGVTISRDTGTIEGQASQFVVDAIATQGRSLQLTAIYLQEQEEIAKFGNMMVTSNLMIPINVLLHPELRDLPQSIDQVMYSNNLKHILTYTLNPGYYFEGGGTGGVYLIELIESGWVLFLALSASLGWFLAKWPSLMGRPYWRYMAFQIFSTVFYMPRAELFPNSLNFIKATIIFLLLVMAVEWLRDMDLRPRAVGQSAG